MSTAEVCKQALALTKKERAALAHELIRSLDDEVEPMSQAEVDRAHAEIAKARLAQYRASGGEGWLDSDEVIRDLRREFGR